MTKLGGVIVGYYDDYNSNRHKIPYDDRPVARNEKLGTRSGLSRGGGSVKMPPLFVSILLILNTILSIVSIVLVKTTTYRNVNNYVLNLGEGSEISMAVKKSAISSTVCVSATNTSEVGAGVIYKVVRNSNDESSNAYNKGTIYFVTCYHVIETNASDTDGKYLRVQLSSSTELKKVKVAGYSSKYDLAVLKCYTDNIETFLWGCTDVTLFDSSYVSQGEQVFAVGNPLGLGITITDGLVSQINSIIMVEGKIHRSLQISAEVNPGNSGGGLFNSSGDFIGIVNAKRDEANNGAIVVEGTSYAIPSSIVRGVAEQIIAGNSRVKKLSLNLDFSNSAKKSVEPVIYSGVTRFIDKYTVSIVTVGSGIEYVGSEKFTKNDVVTKIKYTDISTGEVVTKPVYNEYSFEDYVLLIKPNTVIEFYVEGAENPIKITANSFDYV